MTAPKAARGFAPLPSPFSLQRGGVLENGRIAFESWGELAPARDNAILLFTGLSASAHARSSSLDSSPGWWEYVIGPGAALDTDRFHVICINSLGSCFGSSGPATPDALSGEPLADNFPELSLEDIARGGRAVLNHLGIERAHSVIGASLGGMVALAYVALYPQSSQRLVSISGTMAASPYAIALRSIQREAVLRDPAGLALARKIGTVTYRSAQEFATRFARSKSVADRDFAIEDYLAEQAERFVQRFDPNSYLRLSRAMDLFDLHAHGNPVDIFRSSALKSALVIGIDFDHLFPLEEQNAIAEALIGAGIETRFEELHSLAGHDAFLAEQVLFSKVLGSWLNQQPLEEHAHVAIANR